MNKLKLCTLFVIFGSFIAIAHAKSLDKEPLALYNDELEKKLKLTPQQQETLKQIRKKNQEKMNIFLMEIDTIHHEMAALIDENNEQIREILSEKQKVKFDMYNYQLKKQANQHKNEDKPSRKKMRVY